MSNSKLEEFCIIIDNEKKVYYPGETIKGCVTIILKAEMDVVGISVQFCGRVRTGWEEGAGEQKTIVSGEDILFQYYSLCCGSLPTGKRIDTLTHPAGQSDYPYTFTFPSILPSSFEGSQGSIRYYLKAHIEKPHPKLDIITTVPLTVIDKMDTTESIFMNRRHDETMKPIGCTCIKAGTVFLNAAISRACYLPGEHIPIDADVDNQSRRSMSALKAKLIQYVDYFSNNPMQRKTFKKEVVRMKSRRIASRQKFSWSSENLTIPVTSPSIQNCQLIHVKYVLEVYVDIKCAPDMIIPFDIIIGTIPGHVSGTDVSHSYKSLLNSLPVSFHDEQTEVYKVTHETEYLPIYPYIQTQIQNGNI